MKPSLCLAESINLALRVLQAALDRAMALSVRVSIVVVDAAGLPIHTAHMDSAPLQCRDIAPNKAPTAVVGVPTRVWEERLAGMSDAACQGLPLQPRMALFGGKEPFPFEGGSGCHQHLGYFRTAGRAMRPGGGARRAGPAGCAFGIARRRAFPWRFRRQRN
ncbi:heme-binding protein [Azorhizophilus paspali]|uniref:GlcG/HbpS family heme-binding protein n=1 Tax=Azorhizophilus paspali TaxID=69963 RepID=UPI0036381189